MDNKTAEIIQALAEKLGTTAEYLWSVLLRQAFVTGITSSILACLCIVGLFVCKKLWDKYPQEESSWDFPIRVPIGIAAVACSLFIFTGAYDAIHAFMNPEFWALDYIMKRL